MDAETVLSVCDIHFGNLTEDQVTFINGRDIGDLRVLTEIGAANGLDAQEVEAYLNTDADVGAIHDENVRARRLGINGVPSFAFNEKFVISGAQEPQVLARMLDAALATEDAA